MNFQYVAYTRDRKLIKGRVSATGEEAALDVLKYGGYNVLSLSKITPFIDTEKLNSAFFQIKPQEIVMFSRQLALLIETGTDIVSALDLLRGQLTNRTLKNIAANVAADLRSGTRLSQALEKHPEAFSQLYCRTVAVSEETGSLEGGLRLMADYIEKQAISAKKIRGAMIYPIIVILLAIGVIAVIVNFVMPTFMNLYSSLGADLPTITKVLMAIVGFLSAYGLYLMGAVAAAVLVGFAYTRTPAGRCQWDGLKLQLPALGRVITLNELSRCCRTVALLFRAGVPLPDIMTMAISGTSNKVIGEALTYVREEMLRGQGLAKPMAKRAVFLPLMVQMAAVGEGTGNLDDTLSTVAQSYEMEADDRTNTLISMIQPAMTLFIGGLVGFIAIAMMSTMYSLMGSLGG